MDKLLAFIPVLLSLIAGAKDTLPPIVAAIGALISALKSILPHPTTKLDVAWLQTTLKGMGYDPGPIDNVYGDKTKAAVSAFQTAKGLVVDGWAGVTTTAALLAALPK